MFYGCVQWGIPVSDQANACLVYALSSSERHAHFASVRKRHVFDFGLHTQIRVFYGMLGIPPMEQHCLHNTGPNRGKISHLLTPSKSTSHPCSASIQGNTRIRLRRNISNLTIPGSTGCTHPVCVDLSITPWVLVLPLETTRATVLKPISIPSCLYYLLTYSGKTGGLVVLTLLPCQIKSLLVSLRYITQTHSNPPTLKRSAVNL